VFRRGARGGLTMVRDRWGWSWLAHGVHRHAVGSCVVSDSHAPHRIHRRCLHARVLVSIAGPEKGTTLCRQANAFAARRLRQGLQMKKAHDVMFSD
jgi:hypothetical protein